MSPSTTTIVNSIVISLEQGLRHVSVSLIETHMSFYCHSIRTWIKTDKQSSSLWSHARFYCHSIRTRIKTWTLVLTLPSAINSIVIPLEQGLRLVRVSTVTTVLGFYCHSIRTRIKTFHLFPVLQLEKLQILLSFPAVS